MDVLSKPHGSPNKGIGKPASLDYLTDVDDMARFINRTQHLTDEAYSDQIYDIGGRVAEWMLRATACGADIRVNTKALMYFLSRVDVWRNSKREGASHDEVNVSPAPFVQQPRTPTDSGEDNR